MNTLLITFFWLCLCLQIFAHGRSEEMIKELNAPVPEWMSLAEPIKVEPIEDQSLAANLHFRPRSGGATNSSNRVQIPNRGIEFQVDYSIDYTGNNEIGLGVSLSPDGTKLIVNSGTTLHLHEITSDGRHQEIPIRLPDVTYDDGLKGFITGWSWISNEALVGIGEITDERGHELIENRLYLFRLEERALARLDLSALNLTEESANIELVSIGEDLEHLRILTGDREITVKADLKSPPKLLGKSDPQSPTNPLKGASVWLIILGAIAALAIIAIIIRVLFRKQLAQKNTD